LPPVPADNQSRLLLLFLFFFCLLAAHFSKHTSALAWTDSFNKKFNYELKEATHSTPRGSLMCKAASNCQNYSNPFTRDHPQISQISQILLKRQNKLTPSQ
jgi:hypothetical protein